MKEKEVKELPVLRVNIPTIFFIKRTSILLSTFILVLYKIQYELILVYLVFILPIIFNLNGAIIIEIYPEYFKLINVGVFYKKFKKETVYAYKNIEEFEFEKSKFNLWIGLASTFLPLKGAGANYIYTAPSIMFKYHEGEITNEITKKFSYSTSDLVKSFELIEKNVKRDAHKVVFK